MIRASTRILILQLAAFALLSLGVQQVQAGLVPPGWSASGGGGLATGGADPPYSFSFSSLTDNGFGTLATTDLGGGVFAATGGTLIVTTGLDAGTYSLYPNPSSPNASLSPSGSFIYDDLLMPASNPQLDGDGLLFVNTGFGALGVLDVNIWGNSPGNYSFYSSVGTENYNVANPNVVFNASAIAVPEPGGLTLSGLSLVGFVGMVWLQRRRTAVVC